MNIWAHIPIYMILFKSGNPTANIPNVMGSSLKKLTIIINESEYNSNIWEPVQIMLINDIITNPV